MEAMIMTWSTRKKILVVGIILLVLGCGISIAPKITLAQIQSPEDLSGQTPPTAGQQDISASLSKNATPACTEWYSNINPGCWVRSLILLLAAGMISLTASLFSLCGTMFNWAIDTTVLKFNVLVSGQVLDAIGTGWTFFRDVANIVIIGLFVFVAIGMILGLKEYGQRKYVAQIIIVAILINFSFLFTRIIINFSNALAVQFAAPIERLVVTNSGATASSQSGSATKVPDIASKFSDLLGLQGVRENKANLDAISKKDGSGLWVAVGHAFAVTILLLCVALVFVYGTVLLVVRALVFIFLMLTSAIAFATYLHPKLESSGFGWKIWWEALIRNAILAPVMMLFLFIVLRISQQLVNAMTGAAANGNLVRGGALGGLASQPTDPANISALLVYVVILGLLYGAIQISSRFSGIAGQFAMAATVTTRDFGFASAARPLGLLGRNTLGRGAQRIGDALQSASKDTSRSRITRDALNNLSKGFQSVAKRDFNAGNLTNIKTAKTDLKGFPGQEDRRKKAVNEKAERTTFTEKELEASRKAVKQARDENGGAIGKKSDDNQRQMQDAAKSLEKAAKEQGDATKKLNEYGKEMKTLETQFQKASTSDEKAAIKKDMDRREGDMRRESSKIDDAKSNARLQSQRVVDLTAEGKELKALLDKRAAQLMPSGQKFHEEAYSKDNYQKRLADNGFDIAYGRMSNMLGRATGITTKDNDTFANSIRKVVTDAQEKKSDEKAFKSLYEQMKKMNALQEKGQETAHSDVLKGQEKASANTKKIEEKIEQTSKE